MRAPSFVSQMEVADPKGFLPGNKMTFAGLKKDEDIASVTAYLAGVAEDGSAATT